MTVMRKKVSRLEKLKIRILVLSLLLFFCGSCWVLFLRFEGEAPEIKLLDCPKYFGINTKMKIQLTDKKSGLRKIWFAAFINGKEEVLYNQYFSVDFLKGESSEKKHIIEINLEPKKKFLPDGEGLLRISVWDHSWQNFFEGNNTYIEKQIIIDTKHPKIDMISRKHHFNQGGAGLVLYRVSESDTVNGVQVGNTFFPGMPGMFKDPLVFAVFLAISNEQGPDTEIFVTAEDKAHNLGRAPFTYNIRKKRFKRDIIRITDRFLRKKIPEFKTEFKSDGDLIDKFLKINNEERRANFKTIKNICQNSKNILFWKHSFLRLPKSATRAGFGDRRTYHYKGKVVDHQTHLGIDLASTYHSPIPAANYGKVIFAGEIGIYGRVVIIDHGFGLCSLYSHLSRFSVKPGDTVKRGEILGHTGTTGLAGGDHLHFSILIQGFFTNPLEWWDNNWIKYNITDKISSARKLIKDGF